MTEKQKKIRHLSQPKTAAEWIYRLRFTIARRFVQFCLLAFFIGSARFGFKVADKFILSGDLSSSRILDMIPLADPFAALQRLCAQYWLSPETLIGAGLVLAF